MKPSCMDDAALVAAYEQSLELTRQIGRAIRAARQRTERRIINAVMESDEWATGGPVSMKGTGLCYDLLPPQLETHCCYVPEDEVEMIERCGE
jgi:hypothetical protein